MAQPTASRMSRMKTSRRRAEERAMQRRFLPASAVGVHEIAHAFAIGDEEITGGKDDFGAKGVEIAHSEAVEVGIKANQRLISDDSRKDDHGDGKIMGGMVMQSALNDSPWQAQAAIGGLPGRQARGEESGEENASHTRHQGSHEEKGQFRDSDPLAPGPAQ